MAEKKGKKKQDTAYRKGANTEFHKGAQNAFTGGNAAYQPRDSSIGKPGQEEKPDFVEESNTFTGQYNFNQSEETGKKQPDAE